MSIYGVKGKERRLAPYQTTLRILAISKLKAFADDKCSVASMMISVLDKIENIMGKGDNAGYQHFSFFFCNVFKRPLIQGL